MEKGVDKEIRAVYNQDSIRVYQAYCESIASEAVKLGRFGEHFSMNRMTWIKPSFLWMMYRCGWAQKEGQERVLAIDIKRTGFDSAVRQAVVSTYNKNDNLSIEKWKEMVRSSDVRVQWDPEKDINGNNLPYRSIQIGLRGQAVRDYVNDWIINISDITDYVKELNELRLNKRDISDMLPKEKVYKISD
ncbi:MAG: DUF4291 domain-containing protein [Lachnospiraceae bacterium]|nr:DUF4291 domain-containing protein [Lachnospiraceae bacterium]